jgi:hypothetical protein
MQIDEIQQQSILLRIPRFHDVMFHVFQVSTLSLFWYTVYKHRQCAGARLPLL